MKLIADIIREAGLIPWYQNEDFGHASFMRQMEQGFESGARMIALLSPTYQSSEHCRKEYNIVLADDPSNLKQGHGVKKVMGSGLPLHIFEVWLTV